MTDEELRLTLHDILDVAYPDLEKHYIPDGNQILDKPCIVYEPRKYEPAYAGNTIFAMGREFQVTILSIRPGYADSRNLMMSEGVVVKNTNTFTHDNIVNDVFTVSVNAIAI